MIEYFISENLGLFSFMNIFKIDYKHFLKNI